MTAYQLCTEKCPTTLAQLLSLHDSDAKHERPWSSD